MPSYTNPFTGQTIQPSQVGYELLTISVDTTLQWPVNGNTNDVVANIIEVDATVASLDLYMPAATQVSTGQSALITNVGSNAFTVVDSSGNTIVSIASGIAQYIFLTNNTTNNGTWSSVTFGAGTSSANAAAPTASAAPSSATPATTSSASGDSNSSVHIRPHTCTRTTNAQFKDVNL